MPIKVERGRNHKRIFAKGLGWGRLSVNYLTILNKGCYTAFRMYQGESPVSPVLTGPETLRTVAVELLLSLGDLDKSLAMLRDGGASE